MLITAIQPRFAGAARKKRKKHRGEREFFREFADDSADSSCAERGARADYEAAFLSIQTHGSAIRPADAGDLCVKDALLASRVRHGFLVNLVKESQ
jgi:hypothetical protein